MLIILIGALGDSGIQKIISRNYSFIGEVIHRHTCTHLHARIYVYIKQRVRAYISGKNK